MKDSYSHSKENHPPKSSYDRYDNSKGRGAQHQQPKYQGKKDERKPDPSDNQRKDFNKGQSKDDQRKDNYKDQRDTYKNKGEQKNIPPRDGQKKPNYDDRCYKDIDQKPSGSYNDKAYKDDNDRDDYKKSEKKTYGDGGSGKDGQKKFDSRRTYNDDRFYDPKKKFQGDDGSFHKK